MVAHLGHIRTKYVFFCFPKQKKIFGFLSTSKNLSVIVFPSKRKYFVVFSSIKIFRFVSASKNISLVVFQGKRKYFCFPKQNIILDFA